MLPRLTLDAKSAPRLTSMRAEAKTPDGRCQATVLYPQVTSLGDARREAAVNAYLSTLFKGPSARELTSATAPCPASYLASIGFSAHILPNGLLSVKRTRAVHHGDGIPSSLVATCHLIDLRRGAPLDPSRLVGAADQERIAKLADDALQRRFRVHDLRRAGFTSRRLVLAPGNFSLCLSPTSAFLQLGPDHLAADSDRGAVEVELPLSALKK